MKSIILITLLFFFGYSKCQNLILNGSFEENNLLSSCYSRIDSVQHWFNPHGATPDYFTYDGNCQGVSSINNPKGFQVPRNGSSYAGIVAYVNPSREYIAIELNNQLEQENYYLEFYISLANESMFTVKSIGAFFTNDTSGFKSFTTALPVQPQIENQNNFLSDTLNWIKISGEFEAVGNEKFLLIGNFKNDSNTELELVNPFSLSESSYYYIEDVFLAKKNDLGFKFLTNEMIIYPNPFDNFLYFEVENQNEFTFQLFNLGNLDVSNYTNIEIQNSNLVKVDTGNLPSGIYFLTINNSIIKKLIKY